MISSNIFRDWSIGRRFFRWFWASLAIVCFAVIAQALPSDRAMSEYIRDRWDARQGFPGGPVYAIAQTPDGYLWLGTENGLVRFDGLEFDLFNHANSAILPTGPVIDLMTDSEGNLWIRPQSRTLLRYRGGKFQDVTRDFHLPVTGITAMCPGTNGEVLFAVRTVGIYAFRGEKFSEAISTADLRNQIVISIAQTSDGIVWMGTRDVGLYYMDNGKVSALTKELPDTKVNSLLAIDRDLWIGTDSGIVRWNGHEITKAELPTSLNQVQVFSLTRDSQSNIWIGSSRGLLRVNADGVTSPDEGGNGSSEEVKTTFEDREGDLWLGGSQGLERLRDSPFLTYSASRVASAQGGGTIFVDTQGRKWFAPSEGGLYWEKGDQVGYVKNDGLDHDVVYSLTGSKEELWIGRQRGGLTHLRYKDGNLTTETYTQAEGLAQNTIFAVYQARDGTVWAGSLNGGVSRFKDGRFTTYTSENGLASNTVTSILEGSDGTLWVATANGLSSLSEGRWRIYGGLDGMPPGRVNCLFEDTSGTLWIGTDYGIAILSSRQLQVPRNVPPTLREPVLGIAADSTGRLWLSTSNHVLRVHRQKLLDGKVSEADVREFGLVDGLRSVEGLKRDRTVTVDPFGRIWFSTYRGLSMLEPARLASISAPALAHIERVTADGNPIDLQGPIRIPGSRQRIVFNYAGLSLSVPERVRFQYKLDGYDQDWSDPVAAREATYTNLPPGSYRFRVMASNSAGLWNGVESTIPLEIDPRFWQTLWFRLACVMAIGLSVIVFYRLRLHGLTRQMNLRFEERLAERARIAQDLHDTLLQGFLSASMQLHVAAEQLPTDSPAKPRVTRVLELMKQVTEEGRTTLKGLRRTSGASRDLAQSFSGIQDELALRERVDYRVTVEGPSRPLHPVIRDEIYHIGREALVNAFRHSRAKTIEVELEYGLKQLRVLVRDDGRGIDPQVLRSGREGHWGIFGMRERADKIGARLKLWSRAGAGTEVELSIPGQIAYEIQTSKRPGRWLEKLYPGRTRQDGRK